jgi:hypothetical protein
MPGRRLGGGDAVMQEFIARENVRRFKAQLQACTDDRQRNTISKLLEVEERHLIHLRASPQSRRERSK